MKNLLITGGAGYIGSVLSEQLIDNGFNVTCVDKLNFGSDSIKSLKNKDNFELCNIDINNHNDFKKILNNKKFEDVNDQKYYNIPVNK